MDAESERRYQELTKAVSLIHRHVHADGSPAVVSLSDDRRHIASENTADRRLREMEEAIDRRFREMEEANERRHQELLRVIGALYRHVHTAGSPAIVPLPDIDPDIAPTPADN